MELRNIGEGFLNLLKSEFGIADNEIEDIAEHKFKHCSICDRRNKNRCGVCGCLISAKIRSSSKCPLNKF